MPQAPLAGPEWVLSGYDTGELLGKALKFFEAQQCGKLAPGNRFPWRGNSYDRDGEAEGWPQLEGGWFDAGGALDPVHLADAQIVVGGLFQGRRARPIFHQQCWQYQGLNSSVQRLQCVQTT
jgi:Glycosyl hydrolase family 9